MWFCQNPAHSTEGVSRRQDSDWLRESTPQQTQCWTVRTDPTTHTVIIRGQNHPFITSIVNSPTVTAHRCMQKIFWKGSLKWGPKGRYRGVRKGVFPSPADYGLGSVMSSTAGSGAESRLQTHFQHFWVVIERFRWKENAILLLNTVTILI